MSGQLDHASRHNYCVYGIRIVSDTPLALPQHSHPTSFQIECLAGAPAEFVDATRKVAFDSRSDSWYRYADLPDGSTYVRWDTVGEFLVGPDGRRIAYHRTKRCSTESFQVYMLGQALSCALIKGGLEPLHATAVVLADRAVAFLGANAFGKSTIAASFVQAGCRLLTDDLLVLHDSRRGILAYPGPPRIKLFPAVARRFLGPIAAGEPMNGETRKQVLPLDAHRSCSVPAPLAAIYSLGVPREACRRHDLSVERLSPRAAFFELVRGAFNRRLTGPDRLARQFPFMASLAERVPVVKLVYPRTIDILEDIHEIVVDDLRRRTLITTSAEIAREAVC